MNTKYTTIIQAIVIFALTAAAGPAFAADSADDQVQKIREALAAKKFSRTISLADKWVKKNPNHPLDVEVRMARGEAQFAKKNYYKSLYDFEYVARVYTASEHFWKALEREFEIAELYASGVKRKLLGLRLLSAYGEAEEIYIRIQERAPGSELGERANLALGNQYYNRKEYLNAIDAYEMFLLNYPLSQYRQEVMLRLIRASLARYKGIHYDTTCLIGAIQRIRQYQRNYPQSAQELEMQEMSDKAYRLLADKALLDAKWYTYRKQYVSANYLFERVITDYPDTPASEKAAGLLAKYSGRTAVSGENDVEKVDAEKQTTEPSIQIK